MMHVVIQIYTNFSLEALYFQPIALHDVKFKKLRSVMPRIPRTIKSSDGHLLKS